MTLIKGRFVKRIPTCRKLFIGAWSRPKDSSVYATLKLDMTQVNIFIDDHKQKGLTLRPYHIVLAALSKTLAQFPQLNRSILRGKLYERESVKIFVPVAMNAKAEDELLGVSLEQAHERSLAELVDELKSKVKRLRSGKDKPMKRTQSVFRYCPQILAPFFVSLLDFIFYVLNCALPGLPKDRPGSLILSDLSALGFQQASIPLYPFSRTALSMGLGAEFKEGDTVYQYLSVTADHRVFDGRIAAKAQRYFLNLISNPEKIR